MRLKHLELQGYKTFAARTDFVFDSGVTAIVGPNGSGKSNIADAIRWVLGEQSYRTLRGKRTADMIFSGSAQRARLGMASASLVLDNADRWLPIDFVEVNITRRAYRSGENEYLLNGKRVRLRDITELLSKSGLARRTYTVVGQGLVDAVLSLRPDDRRELFEEASGITLYQAKRTEALSRLEETRANLLRVNDIINEISPRLRRLERQAERAEHFAMLSQQLEGLLRTWYGYRWRQEQQGLARARDALARREARLGRRRTALNDLARRMTGLRAEQSKLREQLGDWHRESSNLHRQLEAVQRDLAVWQERARQLARQRDELQAELAGLNAQAQATAERIAATEQEVLDCQTTLREKEALAAQTQADLDTHESQREALSQQIGELQSQVLELTTRAADRENRLAQLNERRAAITRERLEHEADLVRQQARIDEAQGQLEAAAAEQKRLEGEEDALRNEATRLDTALAGAQNRQSELRAALADVQGSVERLQARYDVLTRLRQEGEGLRAGVRAVLRASGSRLKGIVGSVSQLLHVAEDYEVAIEVALGGHLQDVVVESWPDAEAAISYLWSGERGRVTFLPLDTVRPVPPLRFRADKDVVGVGTDLVRADERLAPVVEMLLGRTVVVRNLTAARRVFDRLKGGFQIVTLAGEVLRSSGSVTGGQGRNRVQGQVLAREREWRELPDKLEDANAQAREIDRALAEALDTEGQLREQAAALTVRQRALEETAAQARAQHRDLVQELERVEQQIAWRQGLLTQLEEEAGELGAQESSLRAEFERFTAGREATDGRVTELQAELSLLSGETLYQHLTEARTAVAVARGSWEHRRGALNSLRERQEQFAAQIETKRQRVDELDEERTSLLKQAEAQASREAGVQGWLSALAAKIEPAEAKVARLDEEREALDREETTLRTRLRQAESGHSQAVLAQSRQEDRLERLRREIMDDFGLVEMEPTEGLPEQPPLPLEGMVSALPLVKVLPEGLEEEIHQIKAQVRRMGSVNPNAPEEYAETLDRYTFLTTQATDLDEAASSLREVIAELDEVMRQEFQATFKQVAARFKENFTQLFGGGTARLLLTDPDDVSRTGVEIIASPPGKRQQTLALLSGGERSLTAVALIFALLEVSPPPFCILDEVDAMLDEANVRRFRRALESLAEKTQFIVITHNRGTIQAANTIYGVSMGDDSVSQVVSLQLEGDQIVEPDGAVLDVAKVG